MSLAATETLDLGGVPVTVREWTLAEIRAYLATPRGEAEVDIVDAALVEGFYLQDIPRFTDLSMAQLEPLAPREIARIVEAIRRLNADFFRLCALAVKLATTAPTPSALS